MKIRHRIFLIAIASALGMTLMMVVGWRAFTGMSQETAAVFDGSVNTVMSKDVPALVDLENAIATLLNADRDAYQALVAEQNALFADSDALWQKANESNIENLAQVKERVDSVIDHLDEDGLAIYRDFEQSFAAWSADTRKVLQDAKAIDQRAEMLAERDKTSQAFSTVRDQIDQMVGGLETRIEESMAEVAEKQALAKTEIDLVNEHARTSRAIFGALALVTVAVTTGLSVWIGLGLSRRVNKIVGKITEVAENRDLVTRLNETSNDEIGMLAKGFDQFSEQIYQTVKAAKQTAYEVAGASTELSATSEEMASTMSMQSSQIQAIVNSVGEMTDSVNDVAKKASGASDNADQAGKVATNGGEVVRDTIARMQMIDEAVSASATAVRELGKRGEQIGEVISVINEIAEQTNLLALNAAIEAARAGEHGRGFAVVADEVRKLADRTTNATEEIADSIKAIQQETAQAVDRMNAGTEQVRDGVCRAQEAGEALSKIVGNTNQVASMVEAIATATEQQTAVSSEINRSIDSVQMATSESAEAAQQSSDAVHMLSRQAEQLQRMINQFRLDG